VIVPFEELFAEGSAISEKSAFRDAATPFFFIGYGWRSSCNVQLE